MRNELGSIEMAERYLRDELSAAERTAFEERLRGSVELEALVDDVRTLHRGFQRMRHRIAVEKAYRRYRAGKWSSGGGGALLLVGIIGAWALLQQHPTEHRSERTAVPPSTGIPASPVPNEAPGTGVVEGIVDTAAAPLLTAGTDTVLQRSTSRTAKEKLTIQAVNAQVEASTVVHDRAELSPPPRFPGGDQAMSRYLMTNLRYPEEALANGTQGRIVVSFIVMSDGSIKDARVVKGLDPACDQEALRVIRTMPAWEPGVLEGKVVNVRMEVPIVFMQTMERMN